MSKTITCLVHDAMWLNQISWTTFHRITITILCIRNGSFLEKNIYPVNNSSLALQFITNLNLNGLTDSESDGLRLALIDQRSAYLIETQILLQSCYLLMNAREYNGAAILLLYVGARFREDAPYSTMIVDNYGPQLYAMLCKLKLKVSTQSKVLIKSIIHSILR